VKSKWIQPNSRRLRRSDVVNTETGESFVEANNEITPAKLQEIIQLECKTSRSFFLKATMSESSSLRPSRKTQSQTSRRVARNLPEDAPGDPPTVQTAYRLLEGMFFDPRKFDFRASAA